MVVKSALSGTTLELSLYKVHNYGIAEGCIICHYVGMNFIFVGFISM